MPPTSAAISAGQPKRPGSWKHSASAGRCTSKCEVVTLRSDSLQLLLPNGYKEMCLEANSRVLVYSSCHNEIPQIG